MIGPNYSELGRTRFQLFSPHYSPGALLPVDWRRFPFTLVKLSRILLASTGFLSVLIGFYWIFISF